MSSAQTLALATFPPVCVVGGVTLLIALTSCRFWWPRAIGTAQARTHSLVNELKLNRAGGRLLKLVNCAGIRGHSHRQTFFPFLFTAGATNELRASERGSGDDVDCKLHCEKCRARQRERVSAGGCETLKKEGGWRETEWWPLRTTNSKAPIVRIKKPPD